MTTVKRRFLLSAVILAVILITVILTVTIVVPNVKEQQLAALRTSAADEYTAGEYSAAEEDYLAVLERVPGDCDAVIALAECYRARGAWEDAVLLLERAYETSGDETVRAALYTMPITFLNGDIHAAICASAGVETNVLTYEDLQKIESVSFTSNSMTVMPGEYGGVVRNTKFVVSVLGNEDFSKQISFCKNAKVSLEFHGLDNEDLVNLPNMTNLYSFSSSGGSISELSVFSACAGLEILTLYDNDISDLAPLSHLTELRELNLSSNQISDITPLVLLTKLENLFLNENTVSDLSARSLMTEL